MSYLQPNPANYPQSAISLSGLSLNSNVSGNVVYLVSGHNEIQGSFTANVSGQPIRISGEAIRISGQTVIAEISGQTISIAGGINVSGSPVRVSGETIYLISGNNAVQMSGQAVRISGSMISVSGQPVNVSGATVIALISGQTVVGNLTTNISGQTVYLISGQNPVQLMMYDASGGELKPLLTDESGGKNLRVAIGTDANDLVADVFTSLSDNKGTSNHGIVTVDYLHAYNAVEDNFARLRATASGQGMSGIAHKLAVDFSGSVAHISGQTVIALISGQTVVANAVTNISGQTVYLASGQNDVQISGQAVRISGSAVRISGETVKISGETLSISGTVAINNVADFSGLSVVANVVTNISGQTIYLVSGQNNVQISGQTINVAGTVPVTTSVSGNVVKISGEQIRLLSGDVRINNVADFSGLAVTASVASNVSGNVVYLTSGQNPVQNSGQAVRVSGQTVIAEISGQTVVGNFSALISGQTVIAEISGQTVVVPFTSVSGNVVRISGEAVRISGQTVYALSGDVRINNIADFSGLAVTASVVTNISGQVVYLTSGQNAVQNSGQAVRISGQTVELVSGAVIINNVAAFSGTSVRISNTGDYPFVGNPGVDENENALYTASRTFGYDAQAAAWNRAYVTASGKNISGIPNKLVVTFSGDSIIGSVSGNMVSVSGSVAINNIAAFSGLAVTASVVTNISGQVVYLVSGQNNVQISGQTVVVAGAVTTSVSGNMVSISGQPVSVSGNMVSTSGQPSNVSGSTVSVSGIVQERIPVQIRTRDTLLITGASGGIALLSGDVLRVTVRNIGISGTVMYVGGSGDYPWVASGQTIFPFFSGHGFWIRDGDGVTIHTQNMANVRVVSHTSGQYVSYIGEAF